MAIGSPFVIQPRLQASTRLFEPPEEPAQRNDKGAQHCQPDLENSEAVHCFSFAARASADFKAAPGNRVKPRGEP
jgi:hypothetical protein